VLMPLSCAFMTSAGDTQHLHLNASASRRCRYVSSKATGMPIGLILASTLMSNMDLSLLVSTPLSRFGACRCSLNCPDSHSLTATDDCHIQLFSLYTNRMIRSPVSQKLFPSNVNCVQFARTNDGKDQAPSLLASAGHSISEFSR
jgi:hypothetical protein